MNRRAPAAAAAASRWSVPWVRSWLVTANIRSKWRRSASPASDVIWWMTASGSALATASPTAMASRPSTTAGSAPSARSRPALAGLLVAAVTWCPCATSSGSNCCPTAPAAPATNTRIVPSRVRYRPAPCGPANTLRRGTAPTRDTTNESRPPGAAAPGQQRDQIEYHGRRGEGGNLRVIVGGGHLHHVGADEVDPGQPAQDPQQFPVGQPAGLRRSGAGRERGVEHVDVQRQIYGQILDPLRDRVDRPAHAEFVDVAGPDGAEAESLVVVKIGGVVDRAPDADVDGVVLDEQVLLEGPPEDRAVRGRRVEVGVPRVEVRVEMHERDGAVLADGGAEQRQRDGVVAADGDDRPAAVADLGRVAGDLLHRPVDRERGDGHVAGVDDLDLAERGAVQLDVMAGPQVPGGLADGHRPEPGPGTVRGAAVERRAEHGDVVVGDPVDLRNAGERAGAGEPGHLPPVHRPDRLAAVLAHCLLPVEWIPLRPVSG